MHTGSGTAWWSTCRASRNLRTIFFKDTKAQTKRRSLDCCMTSVNTAICSKPGYAVKRKDWIIGLKVLA